MARPNNRDRLLATAVDVVVAEGASALTYERLADVAEVSKGGILYHFATKEALVGALLDHVLDAFEADVERMATDDTRPAAWTRAYIGASLRSASTRPDLAVAVLLTAPEVGPALLRRCGTRFAAWQQRIVDDGVPPQLATTIRYACDGWWTFHALGAAPAADATALHAHLQASLDEVFDASRASPS